MPRARFHLACARSRPDTKANAAGNQRSTAPAPRRGQTAKQWCPRPTRKSTWATIRRRWRPACLPSAPRRGICIRYPGKRRQTPAACRAKAASAVQIASGLKKSRMQNSVERQDAQQQEKRIWRVPVTRPALKAKPSGFCGAPATSKVTSDYEEKARTRKVAPPFPCSRIPLSGP